MLTKRFFYASCLCVLYFTLLWFNLGIPSTCVALLRQHHESPGVMRYHSLVSIQDPLGYTWQVVVFQQRLNALKKIHLRLVGFPGVVEFVHPRSLEILTNRGKLLIAADIYANSSPAANVGEYEMTNILPQINSRNDLKLFLPLNQQQPLTLSIPGSVVTEWQWLITDIDAK